MASGPSRGHQREEPALINYRFSFPQDSRKRALAAGVAVIAVTVAAIIALLAITGGDGDGGAGAPAGRNGDSDNGSNGSGNGGAGEATPPPTPMPTIVASEFVPPPDGFAPPSLGAVSSECTARGNAVAVLSWTPGDSESDGQEVNLLPGGDNFVPGNYLTSGGLDAQTSTITRDDLEAGAVYFWRVNTRVGDNWVAGNSARFETARCLPPDSAQ